MCLDLFLSLICCFWISLLQERGELIVVLIQIYLIGDYTHSILYLDGEFADLFELFKVKARLAIEVYKLVLLVCEDFSHPLPCQLLHG